MKLADYQRELGKEGKKIFEDWRKKYGLSQEKELFLLGIIAESHETILRSRKIISKEGSSIQGSHGRRPHPEIAISKDAKNQALAAIKELGHKLWKHQKTGSVISDFRSRLNYRR